jgi:DNA repair exonuclease SbcCD ATPase subunit
MHVAKILLWNFGPFLGEHEIALEPIAYSVVAERDGDAHRSNFLGKSSLLEAVVFALYGTHRHRLEEGWISEGEKDGSVGLVLSDQTSITRSKVKGAGTKLAVDVLVTGDDAQKSVEASLLLTEADFRTTSYFAQGATAGLVRADPGARTETVSAWLGLERLQRCLKRVRDRGAAANARADALATRRAVLAAEVEPVDLGEELGRARAKLAEWEEVSRLVEQEQRQAGAKAAREIAEREVTNLTDKLVAHVAEHGLEVDLSDLVDSSEHILKVHRRDYEEAQREKDRLDKLVRGMFDGTCPVDKRACPVAKEINAPKKAHQEEHEKACERFEQISRVVQEDLVLSKKARLLLEERQKIMAALEHAQRTVAKLAQGDATTTSTGLSLDVVRSGLRSTDNEVSSLSRRIEASAKASREIEELDAKLAKERREERACAEAASLFGPHGAQRRIAEGAIADVADKANAILADAGIELQVDLTWEREGKDPADECDCGELFPQSRKAKACGRCGAPRGMKRIRRLDVELSARSGAAEDLAGLALSLSASAWLRGARGSEWSSVLLDEPAAQLDRAHRKAFAQHLPRILKAARIDQALVVSHDPSSVASLTGRIVIRSDGKWARVEVES